MNTMAYQLWYEFLKRSKKYEQCCENDGTGEMSSLYKDFGDVHTLSWSKWWREKKKLFTDIEPEFVIDEIKTYAEFKRLFDEGEDDLLAVVINLNSTKSSILKEVNTLINQRKVKLLDQENASNFRAKNNPSDKILRGRPKFNMDFHRKYGLANAPSSRDIKALGVILKVYDACLLEDAKPSGSNRKKRYQIGEKLGIILSPTVSTKANQVIDRDEYRNNMTATVCRYNRWAKQIIKNVEQGLFPKHD
jgi:hypothetical protein